jgi:hypothetical protein
LPKNVKPKAKKPVITIPLIIKEVNDSMEDNSELFTRQELYSDNKQIEVFKKCHKAMSKVIKAKY